MFLLGCDETLDEIRTAMFVETRNNNYSVFLLNLSAFLVTFPLVFVALLCAECFSWTRTNVLRKPLPAPKAGLDQFCSRSTKVVRFVVALRWSGYPLPKPVPVTETGTVLCQTSQFLNPVGLLLMDDVGSMVSHIVARFAGSFEKPGRSVGNRKVNMENSDA